MVRIHPDPPGSVQARWLAARWLAASGIAGAVAQLGERLLCKQEVVGSIPSSSTMIRDQKSGIGDQKVRLHPSVAVVRSTQRCALIPPGEQRAALRAAVFFNNWEGKGSHDLMRVV